MAEIRYKTGERYGNIVILGHESKPYFKNIVRCCLCGREFKAPTHVIATMGLEECGCSKCKKAVRDASKVKELSDQYVGRTYGHLTILAIKRGPHPYGKSYTTFAICRCGLCGSVQDYILSRVISGQVRSCSCVDAPNLQAGREAVIERMIAGTIVSAISSDRKLNENSTSGHRGVSWSKSCGKWRAYINLARKQKNLGLYDRLEDAIAARRAAEEELYRPIIEEWEGGRK